MPDIRDGTVDLRVIYIENPRFPPVEPRELQEIVATASALVRDHFGITIRTGTAIQTIPIDTAFREVAAGRDARLDRNIGDFRNGRVDWQRVEKAIAGRIAEQTDPLEDQVAFAAPYLLAPVKSRTVDGFTSAVTETFKSRLLYWTRATLPDGHPVIGAAPGLPDLPYNEYAYWMFLAKQGFGAEIVLTNQLVASVEYGPTPIHSSIRGGITGGATEYDPTSRLGTSVWVSLFPYFTDDPELRTLRNGESYDRKTATRHAGAMLAHELGHQLLHLGHPWSNEACVMRPVELLDFGAWTQKFDAKACPLGSSEAMTPGAVKIPVW